MPHTVLLVDDEPNVLAGLQRVFYREGYEILCANSGNEALNILRTKPVDVVISDQDMPGMTGTAFLAKVREEFPETIRFILTGKATLDHAIQAINTGAVSRFFTKPCNNIDLTVAIRQALQQKDLKLALEEARQKELEIKDQFLSHVSHELRSPITVIYQFVTILLDGLAGDLAPQQREYLEIVLRNINQLRIMINDLLEVTRIGTGKLTIDPHWTSLADLITETIEAFRLSAAEEQIKLITDLPGNLPKVYIDSGRIRQVLTNVIDNAIKFTPASGTITVKVVPYDVDPHFLCVSVTDTGCGIRPEDKERIFDRLSQAASPCEKSRKGLGLGLYLCKEFIIRHGGHIWAESELGHGSTFFFTLPVFSLSELLSPLLAKDNLLKYPVTLIAIAVFPCPERLLTSADISALSEIHQTLERCFLTDAGILLPRIARSTHGEIFFGVVSMDEHCVDRLVQHIRERLLPWKTLQKSALETRVSFRRMRSAQPHPKGTSCERLVKDLLSSLEEVVETRLLNRRNWSCLEKKFC